MREDYSLAIWLTVLSVAVGSVLVGLQILAPAAGYAFLIGGLAAMAVSLIFIVRLLWRRRARGPLLGSFWGLQFNAYVVVAAILAIGSLAALVGYFVDKARGPIIWDFSANRYYLGLSRSGNDPIWVSSIQMHGRNRWDVPVSGLGGYVQSDRGQKLPLAISLATQNPHFVGDAIKDAVVPAKDKIDAYAFLPSEAGAPREGMTADNFLAQYPGFRFIFETEGVSREYRFSEQDIEALIDRFRRETRQR